MGEISVPACGAAWVAVGARASEAAGEATWRVTTASDGSGVGFGSPVGEGFGVGGPAVAGDAMATAAAGGRVGEAAAGLVRGKGTAAIPTSAHWYEYCIYAASVDLTVFRFRPFE